MPLIHTEDRKYLFAVDDYNDMAGGTPQSVVYRNGVPIWDRHSYEAGLGEAGPPVVPVTPVPAPVTPPSEPAMPLSHDVRVLHVTTSADGAFAPRMMSDRANAWIQDGTAYVFAGSRDTGGPIFFGVGLASGHVTRLGALVPYVGETEFWYWTPGGAVMIAEGTRLHRVNPFKASDDVVVMDASSIPGAYMIDQWHSSDDGTTHSATVKNADYQKVGTVTMHRGKLDYWPKVGVLDESQVSRDGRFVVIKENRGGDDKEDNRVINLDSRDTRWLLDVERALGHSDCGPDYIVGEADKPDPGACVIRYLDRLTEAPKILFHTLNLGYVSTRGRRCLHSGDTHLSWVALDGSGVTPVLEHGAHAGIEYDLRVKANLDPTGQVATYMINGQVLLAVLG